MSKGSFNDLWHPGTQISCPNLKLSSPNTDCKPPTARGDKLDLFISHPPSCLQIEVHPYLQCERLVSFAQSLGVLVTAFSPLGHGQSYAMLGYGDKVAIKVDTTT